MSMDFNNAEKQFDSGGDFEPIPEDTLVDLVFTIKPGHVGDGGWLTQGKPSAKSSGGWQYISAEMTIIGGDYDKRKVWQNFMWNCVGPTDAASAEKTANITRSNLRALLESARNIQPADESPAGQQGRQINDFGDLNGMQFKAKLRIEPGNDGYAAKNQIKVIITPDMPEYGAAPQQAVATAPVQVGQAADAVVAQAATTQPAGNTPAWAS